ncbi:hypothetical protein FRC03_010939 [Tulasnella sp. 419]|nr:hypothetical protein FRC03_010939 [Tulasnella sp. 419]
MTTVPQSASSTQPKTNVNPSEVGWQFVPQYYTFVNKQPQRLHCFYTKNSTFIHGTEGEDSKACYGQQEIHQKIMSLNYVNCKVFINSVDAQSSANNGIIIQVIGEMSNRGEPWRKFVQTFFLAEQPNGYFVLNDVFRFLKEESVGEEDEEELEPGETPAPLSSEQPIEPQTHVTIDHGAATYDPDTQVSLSVPTSDQVTVPPPQPEPSTVEVQLNGPNGHSSPLAAESEIVEEEGKDETTHDDAQADSDSAPATPAPEPNPEAPAAEAVDEPTTEPAEASTSAPAPTPSSAAAHPQPVVHAPTPSAPSGPKTWATLAASNNRKWGSQIAQEAKGVSSAAPPTPPTSTTPQPQQKSASNTNKGDLHPNAQAVMSITSGQCFVKGVTENIPDSMLKDVLTTRFGPIKELEIVRNKACAFLEFASVEAARKAILASLSPAQGGEGGVRMPHNGPGLPPRVTIEMRKERGERPVSRPRPTGPSVGDRNTQASGHGQSSEGGRGANTGASMRGSRGGGGSSRGRGGGGQK